MLNSRVVCIRYSYVVIFNRSGLKRLSFSAYLCFPENSRTQNISSFFSFSFSFCAQSSWVAASTNHLSPQA